MHETGGGAWSDARLRESAKWAVKLIQERGVSVAQAARDLGVQGSVLRRWVQESVADAAQAFPGQGPMKPEQAELARFRRESSS